MLTIFVSIIILTGYYSVEILVKNNFFLIKYILYLFCNLLIIKAIIFPSLLKKEQKQTEPAHRLTHQLTQPKIKPPHTNRLLGGQLLA